MQTKVELQGKLTQQLWKEPVALNSAERSLTDWAMVDDHQAILDVNCVRDHLLRHYLSNYRVRACGLCLDAQQAHHLRHALSGAEIMYSTGNEIPWRDDSFDRIFMAHPLPNYINMSEFALEVKRVLKVDGRLILALPPLPWWQMVSALWQGNQYRHAAVQPLLALLEMNGFADVSCRHSRIGQRCVVAHKAS